MNDLTPEQMATLSGGDAWTTCGIATGVTIGATLLYGGIGFALTANKAFALCTLAAFV